MITIIGGVLLFPILISARTSLLERMPIKMPIDPCLGLECPQATKASENHINAHLHTTNGDRTTPFTFRIFGTAEVNNDRTHTVTGSTLADFDIMSGTFSVVIDNLPANWLITDNNCLGVETPPYEAIDFGETEDCTITVSYLTAPTKSAMPYFPETPQPPQINPSIAAGPDDVYLSNGELFLDETDLRIPGRGFDYTFQRNYKSQINYDGPIGYNWNFNYNTRLQAKGPNYNSYGSYVCVVDGQARRDCFFVNSDGSYKTPAGMYDRLTKSSGVFVLRNPDGMKYFFKDLDGTSTAGTMQKIEDRNGNRMSFGYDPAGRLQIVTDTLGRNITYGYNGNGRLTTVTDFTSRQIVLSYDSRGDLISVRSPAVTGTSNGNDFASGKLTKYTYSYGFFQSELNHNLLTITRPNEASAGPASVTNIYGNNSANPLEYDRVIYQDYGGTNAAASARSYGPAGGRFSFKYETPSSCFNTNNLTIACARTTMVDRNGNVSAYEHNLNGHRLKTTRYTGRVNPDNPWPISLTGKLRASDPNSFVTASTFNANGEVLQETYPAGNYVTYTYDSGNANIWSKGNLLAITKYRGPLTSDQTQWTTSYTYEPIFNQVRTVTPNRGNDTSFSPPISDVLGNVRPIDFNLDNDKTDPNETTRRFRYTTLNVFDYQEGNTADILSLAGNEGVTLSSSQAAALQLSGDINGDGSYQTHGNVIEVDQPNVTLESGSAQSLITTNVYNTNGQLTSTANPEGNLEVTTYFTSAPKTGYKESVTSDAISGSVANSGTLRHTIRPDVFAQAKVQYDVDQVGNVISINDERGIKTTYEINQLNQPIRETRGIIVTGVFDPNYEEPNHSITDLSYQRKIWYDANNNVVQQDVQNLDGDHNPGTPAWLTTTLEYDILDKQIVERQQVNATDWIETLKYYDQNANPVLTVSPLAKAGVQPNNITATVYDERDLPFTKSRGGVDSVFTSLRAAGKAHEYITYGSLNTTGTTATVTKNYDGNKNLAAVIDAEDNGTAGNDINTYEYDGLDRLKKITDPMGDKELNTYDPDDNLVNVTKRGSGNVRLSDVNHDFDELNRTFRDRTEYFKTPGESNDGEYVQHYLFDRNGQVTLTTDPRSQTVTNVYDGLDRVVTTLDNPLSKIPSGTVQNELNFTYDDNSNVIRKVQIDRSPTSALDETLTTVTLYDAVNRPIRQTDNYGNTTRVKYDSRDNAVQTSDARGTLMTDSISNAAYRYPYTGSPASQINDVGNITNNTFDGLNRLLETSNDLRIGGVGSGGLDTSNANNSDGRVTTSYAYDQNSRITSQTDDQDTQDGTRNTTLYYYDDLNRNTQIVFADGNDYHYTYDRDGHVTQITDPNGSTRTSPVSSGYDNLGRKMLETVIPGSGVSGTTSQTFAYDGLSRLTSSTNVGGAGYKEVTYNFFFDSLSRPTRQDQVMPGNLSLFYEYDQNGNPIQLTYPNGRKVNRQYDGQDRVSLIEEESGDDITAFSYLGPSRLLNQVYNQTNDITTALSYDGSGRVIRSNATGATFSLDLNYAYNRNSDRLYEKFSNTDADVFTADSVSRLTSASYGVPSAGLSGITNNQLTNPAVAGFAKQDQWTLDGAQNWRAVTTETPGSLAPEPVPVVPLATTSIGQIKVPAVLYVDEPMGTETTTIKTYTPNSVNAYSDVNGTNYSYDKNGNLIDDGTNLYTYDAYNRLIKVAKKTNPSQAAYYSYDATGRRVHRIVQGLNSINEERRYVYNGWNVVEERDQNNAMVAQYVDGIGADQHYQMKVNSGAVYYYHQNPLGNVEAMTDGTGTSAVVYDYDAYGQSSVVTGTSINPYRYNGQRYDPETGLLYYRNRHYDPVTGRFLQRDPQGMWDDSYNDGNGYTYVGNNPTGLIDYLGLSTAAAGVAVSYNPSKIELTNSTPIDNTATTGAKKPDVTPPVVTAPNVSVVLEKGIIDKKEIPITKDNGTAKPGSKVPDITVGVDTALSGKFQDKLAGVLPTELAGNVVTASGSVNVGDLTASAGLSYDAAQVTVKDPTECVGVCLSVGFGIKFNIDLKTGKISGKIAVGAGVGVQLDLLKIGTGLITAGKNVAKNIGASLSKPSGGGCGNLPLPPGMGGGGMTTASPPKK